MAKIDRYNGNVKAVGSEALGTERTIFGSTDQSDTLDANITTDLLRGWGIVGVNENPTKQDFNGLAFTLGQLIAYLHQSGVPEWNAGQEVYEGSVVTTLAGVYRLKSGGDGSVDPDIDGGVNWERAPELADVDNAISDHVALADPHAQYAEISGATFTGQVTYAGAGGIGTNTAFGENALSNNTLGNQNTATGLAALSFNTEGISNTATGLGALSSNTLGDDNTATGVSALSSNTLGNQNTATGVSALSSNTLGSDNTAIGVIALSSNTLGSDNTAIGRSALLASTTFSNSSGLGHSSQVTGSNQVQLGDSAATTYVYGTVQNRSDLRDKTDVRDTVLGLDFIQSLRAVDYRWDMREDYQPDAPDAPDALKADATDDNKAAYDLALTEYEIDKSDWLIAVKHGNLMHDGTHTRSRYHHGLIAQEVYDVIESSGVDFGGYQDHKLAGGEDVLSIGYDELIGPLIKAVQELKDEFDAYKLTHP